MYNLNHLSKKEPIYSIQNDEALFLYSLVKLIAPKIIIEIGFLEGYSTINFLAAMSPDGSVYSFDPDTNSAKKSNKIKDKRFKFINKQGQDFSPKDINKNLIDLVFLDASHDLKENIEIFENISRSFSPNCIVVIHDTGLYNDSLKENHWTTPKGFMIGKGYAHQPDERRFVNYLKTKFPEFQQINLHSLNVGRLGMTILQKYQVLEVKPRL